MSFDELVRKRRMVRNFSENEVPRDKIERIVDLARRGPSAGFSQGQFFVVVTDAEKRRAIAKLCSEKSYIEAGFDPWLSKAPVHIIPCTSEAVYHHRYQQPDKVDDTGAEINWPVPYWFMDVGCAVMLLLLAVVDEGLAAGFAGTHHLDKLQALLGIPADVTPVGVIPVGYAAEDKRSPSLKRGRKSWDSVVHFESWGA